MSPAGDRFKSAYDLVVQRIEARYHIPVSISDVLDPNTGDFDGLRILVDYDQDLESALFVVAHLFGHTVQWNISAEYREVGHDLSIGKGPEQLAKIYDYEKNATRMSLQLMHEAGVTDLDQWLSDWWAADWRYLEHYYKTGEKLDFRKLLEPGKATPLTPIPIPPFTPQKWLSRWSF
ncbi:MAG: hypothetical protein IT370_29480 [Deltaproteobacteria bacterium]|nr:hypothetical protein [Deltaproteobacteria bacterium]